MPSKFSRRCVTHPPPRPGLLELCGGHAVSRARPPPRPGLLELRVTLVTRKCVRLYIGIHLRYAPPIPATQYLHIRCYCFWCHSMSTLGPMGTISVAGMICWASQCRPCGPWGHVASTLGCLGSANVKLMTFGIIQCRCRPYRKAVQGTLAH